MMASMMDLPHNGHLEQLIHIFAYLKQRYKCEMVFNPTLPDFDEALFKEENQTYTPYTGAKESVPSNAPNERSMGFKISTNVGLDHAGDNVTRQSRTGYIIFLNSSPIYWDSKKQGGIESSSFESEFITMKECCEYIHGLRYKLRMMGIPIDGTAFILGDNKSVLTKSSMPTSVLRKKSNSIAFHLVREGSVAD